VTKLSLLLKVLEGEDEQSIGKQQALFQERVLPDLSNNIKCGNSLIGSDFYENRQMNIFDEEEIYRVNAFDWDAEFPDIMEKGGFDAVIGNPPYIRIQAMKEWTLESVEHYKIKYETAKKGNYDIYVLFVEKGLSLILKNGVLGFILPNKFFSTDYGKAIRQIVSKNKALVQLIDFGYAQVFEQATTYTCLLFLSGNSSKTFHFLKTESPIDISLPNINFNAFPANSITSNPWMLVSSSELKIVNKIKHNSISLLDISSNISRGSSTGNDKIFILKRLQNPNEYLSSDAQIVKIESPMIRIALFATDFNRYIFAPKCKKVIIFPYQNNNGKFELIQEDSLKNNYPNTYNYLYSRKKLLIKRKQFKSWYSFSAPRNLMNHDNADMVVPLLADKGLLAQLPENKIIYCLMASGGFSISIKGNNSLSNRFIIGLLNSSLLFWYLKSISNKFRGGWITCTKQYMGQMPIKKIDFSISGDKLYYGKIVSLVDQILNLKIQEINAKLPQEKKLLQRQIQATDYQIDRLVYKLYDLTDEEIRIVEAAT